MATLVLGVAGGALGSVFGGIGAILGRAAGALAGYALDSAVFGSTQSATGRACRTSTVQSSTEGASIPRVYRRAALGPGDLGDRFRGGVSRPTRRAARAGRSIKTTEYSYFANFAVGLCEGPIARIGRIWADGKILDQAALHLPRLYGRRGAGGRQPDRRQGGRARRRPIAARPMSCSSACRWPISAIACRSFPSRCSARFPASRTTCAPSTSSRARPSSATTRVPSRGRSARA